MKILQNFDKIVTDVLAEKVKARLTFKVPLWAQCARDIGLIMW